MLEYLAARVRPLLGISDWIPSSASEQLFTVARYLPSEEQWVSIEDHGLRWSVRRPGYFREETLPTASPAVTLRNVDKVLVLVLCADLTRYLLRVGGPSPLFYRLADLRRPTATDLLP
jgi:hypothetical protein